MTGPKRPKSKKPGQSLPEPVDRSAVIIPPNEAHDVFLGSAQTLTRPEILAAVAIEHWGNGIHDVNFLAEELGRQVAAVNQGDLRRAEGMLISQAQTLETIFVTIMRMAVGQTSLQHWETYMRIGLKAQSQSRATLQVLADLKNPRPVAFVKQANINNGGQQQVNNGALTDTSPARVGNFETEQSKLFDGDAHGGADLDTGTTQTASRGDTAMATMDCRDRAKKRSR